jgi:hypothetical protein
MFKQLSLAIILGCSAVSLCQASTTAPSHECKEDGVFGECIRCEFIRTLSTTNTSPKTFRRMSMSPSLSLSPTPMQEEDRRVEDLAFKLKTATSDALREKGKFLHLSEDLLDAFDACAASMLASSEKETLVSTGTIVALLNTHYPAGTRLTEALSDHVFQHLIDEPATF